jgi:hypothetical protein
MRAITVWPEWAYAICYLGKRIENRSWAPPPSVIGKHIAIHAGKNIGGKPGQAASLDGTRRMLEMAGYAHQFNEPDFIPCGAIVAAARIDGCIQSTDNRWAVPGQKHWQLSDITVLPEPIPSKGAQRLWAVTPDQQREMERQITAANVLAPIISGIDLHVYDEYKLKSPGGFGVKYEGKSTHRAKIRSAYYATAR